MAFRHSEIRPYCRCKQPAEHACVRCRAPVCSNGLCFVPALSSCIECAQAARLDRQIEAASRYGSYPGEDEGSPLLAGLCLVVGLVVFGYTTWQLVAWIIDAMS